MDFLLKKKYSRVIARIPDENKSLIQTICELRGLNESQYINLAIENQIKSDLGNFKAKKQPKTPQP